jgi:hypothetical protein
MKKTLFVIFLSLAVGGHLFAQEGDRHVPSTVRHSFQRDYPEARDPQWSSEHGQWHANFQDHSRYDRGEMVAHYDHYGHHIDSHIPYDPNDVPQPVVERTQKHYQGGRGYSYERIERPGAEPLFQVSVDLQGGHKTVFMDENGRERMHNDRH